MDCYGEMRRDVERIRAMKPLVHNITNFVVMNSTANALLALGASPVMAHAREEAEEMARIAGALVVNVGTLSPGWVDAMELAMRAAAEAGVPIVYDPVGAGATDYRNEVNKRLLTAACPTIVRGNGSEIMAVAAGFGLSSDVSSSASSSQARTKGVDSAARSTEAVRAARALASFLGCVVVVSGPVDFIVSSAAVAENRRGTPMMERVTGMGCTATAICGAFAAANSNPAEAALHAMELMGICGEEALTRAKGPGSFQMEFLDALYGFE